MVYEKSSKLHIVAVVAVIRNKEGKYLVLKRSEWEKAYPGMYTFPGGKVEDNDSIEETLEREVLEETGLVLKTRKILLKDKSFTRPDNQTVKVFSYLCDVEKDGPVIISDEHTDYKWVDPEELPSLNHVGIEEELRVAEEVHKLDIDVNILSTKSVKET